MISMNEIKTMSAATFNVWKNDCMRADSWYRNKAKKNKEEAKRDIEKMKIQIKELKEVLKKPLPKNRKLTKDAYKEYVEESKKNALENGYKWVEPN